MAPPRQITIKNKARMEETIMLVEQQDIETRITQMQSSAEPQQISDPFMSALLAGAEHLAKTFITRDIAPHLLDLDSRKKRSTATEPSVSATIKTRSCSAVNLESNTEDLINDTQALLGTNEHLTNFPKTIKAKISREVEEEGLLDRAIKEFAECSEKSPLGLSAITFQLDTVRDSVLQIIKHEIYQIWSKPTPKNEASVAQLDYRVTNAETMIQSMFQKMTIHEQLLHDIHIDIGSLIRKASHAAFLEEEQKLRLDAQDQRWWSTLDQKQQERAIEDLLQLFTTDESWKNFTIIIFPKLPHNKKGWIKVDFNCKKTRTKFEQWLKVKRSGSNDRRSFWSTRLVPTDFLPIKDKLVRKATEKVALDWVNTVIAQKQENIWVTDYDMVLKAMYVRVQWSITPLLKIWIECLDPIHRHVWKQINFTRSETNHFKNYKLSSDIPCPDTLEKATEDPSYGTPRPSKFGNLKLPQARNQTAPQEISLESSPQVVHSSPPTQPAPMPSSTPSAPTTQVTPSRPAPTSNPTTPAEKENTSTTDHPQPQRNGRGKKKDGSKEGSKQ